VVFILPLVKPHISHEYENAYPSSIEENVFVLTDLTETPENAI
jgi:hypothetical protein